MPLSIINYLTVLWRLFPKENSSLTAVVYHRLHSCQSRSVTDLWIHLLNKCSAFEYELNWQSLPRSAHSHWAGHLQWKSPPPSLMHSPEPNAGLMQGFTAQGSENRKWNFSGFVKQLSWAWLLSCVHFLNSSLPNFSGSAETVQSMWNVSCFDLCRDSEH